LHGNFCRRQAELQKERQELSYERQQGVQLREEFATIKWEDRLAPKSSSMRRFFLLLFKPRFFQIRCGERSDAYS